MAGISRKKLQGLYLVVDTKIPEGRLIPIVEQALEGGVDILQLWGETQDNEALRRIARKILALARTHGVPCLIADDVDVCQSIGADGVHFDGYSIPAQTPKEVKQIIGTDKIVGVTCGNSVEKLRWALENGADYVSFCSVFPSASVDTCELVPLEMIHAAKVILNIPVFASGGITAENIHKVLEAGADGIAVVSAIMNASDPKRAAEEFKQQINAFLC